MPPKRDSQAPAAAAPPPPSAAVVASQGVVEKWTDRSADITRRVSENNEHLQTLATQKVTREGRLKELLAEVSTIMTPKPPEPDQAALKAAKGKKPADLPPPPPPPDEEELKKLQKLQNAVNAIYKKKRERPLVRDTPPPTADSAKRSMTAGSSRSAAESTAAEDAPETPAAAPAPTVPDEPGIVKPADLDPEIWVRVLHLRDERIDTEEALANILSNIEVAEARRKNLVTLEQVTGYSANAANWELEKAKAAPPPPLPTDPKPPSTPSDAMASGRRNSQRPPSQLLRR